MRVRSKLVRWASISCLVMAIGCRGSKYEASRQSSMSPGEQARRPAAAEVVDRCFAGNRAACSEGCSGGCPDCCERAARANAFAALDAGDIANGTSQLATLCTDSARGADCYEAAELLRNCHDCLGDDATHVWEARRLYALACENGHASACTRLGGMFAEGHGGLTNAFDAGRKYRRGCELGDVRGCLLMAELLEAKVHLQKDFGSPDSYRRRAGASAR